MVGRQASSGPGPCDSGQGAPSSQAVEHQALALLHVSDGGLDGDRRGHAVRWREDGSVFFEIQIH